MTTNTQLNLDLSATSGTLHFAKGSDGADVVLSAGQSNAALIASLTSRTGVAGRRGRRQRAGQRHAAVGLHHRIHRQPGRRRRHRHHRRVLTAASAAASVSTTQASSAGVSELKQITIERLRGAVPNVDVSVSEVVAAALGISEIKSIVFTTPYSTTGNYDISAAGRTQTVVFKQNDVENNKRVIRDAMLALFNVASGITVSFDANYKRRPPLRHHLQRHAGQPGHRRHHDHRSPVRRHPAAEQAPGPWPPARPSASPSRSSTATGSFQLSLNYLTLGTFTTGDIAFGATRRTWRPRCWPPPTARSCCRRRARSPSPRTATATTSLSAAASPAAT
jgi:uncharacterized protein YceH (UPF0502 family)